DQRGDLLLLLDFPVDELLDVRMIDVDDDHLRGAAGGAPTLDRASGAIADAEEAHQPGGRAATRERIALDADGGEVGGGAGAVLEITGLAPPEVNQPARLDEWIGRALNEAGVGLGPGVGVGTRPDLAEGRIDIIVTLC